MDIDVRLHVSQIARNKILTPLTKRLHTLRKKRYLSRAFVEFYLFI